MKNNYTKIISKKYDILVISFIILYSFLMLLFFYFSIVSEDYEKTIYSRLPCFMQEQSRFIEEATFGITEILTESFNAKSLLFELVFENLFGAIILLGLNHSLRKFYLANYKKKLHKISNILLILYYIYLFIIFIIIPIISCSIQIG